MAIDNITQRRCSIEHCDRPHRANSFCNAHNTRWLLHGEAMDTVTPIQDRTRRKQPFRKCSIDNCERQHFANGWCDMHLRRFYKHGNPLIVKCEYREVARQMTDEDFPQHFWSRVALTADTERCWEWQGGCEENGYGTVYFDAKPHKTHRVAYELFYKVKPVQDVLHSCDNRKCVNPHHLSEGTNADNIRDKMDRGRSKPAQQGWAYGRSKVSPEQVREIRTLLGQEVTVREIAERFEISRNLVRDIRRGKTWKQAQL